MSFASCAAAAATAAVVVSILPNNSLTLIKCKFHWQNDEM